MQTMLAIVMIQGDYFVRLMVRGYIEVTMKSCKEEMNGIKKNWILGGHFLSQA